MRRFSPLLARAALLLAAAGIFAANAPAQGKYFLYAGTSTNRSSSKGIYVYRYDAGDGKVEPLGIAAETPSPTFLAVHPNHRFLYAVNEISNFTGPGVPAGGRVGSVTAFSIDAGSGRLTQLNAVSSKGGGPTHLSIDPGGKWVAAANYGGGSVVLFPVKADGSLGEAAGFVQHTGSSATPRQTAPHAHGAYFSPDSRFLFVADLGLDKIMAYRISSAGALEPLDPAFAPLKPGSGPRHMAFAPNGRFAYSANELNSTVTAFSFDKASGRLAEIQTVPSITGYDGSAGVNYPSEVEVDSRGRFLYLANRNGDNIAVFAIGADGKLTPSSQTPVGGKYPRHFALDPSGNFLFVENQNSDNITEFRVDKTSGGLSPTGVDLKISIPMCVVFVPASN
ncbi:MAG: 6-phosphogluconolactonase [Proteobacteria bacterium]|nr:MAG: 6-phosphogluconolactonase [Pseudomonadota bacterium]